MKIGNVLVFSLIVGLLSYAAKAPKVTVYKNIWENPNQPDSLRFKAINAYYEKTTFALPDSVLSVIEYHFDLARTKSNKTEMIKALSEKSFVYYIKDNIKKSEDLLKQAINIQTTLNDSNTLASLYTNLASVNRAQSKFLETIKYYNYALQIATAKKDQKLEAAVLGNLGLVYYDITNYEIAEYYFQKSLDIYKKLALQDKIGYISLYLGAIDYEKGNYAQSIDRTEKALQLFESSNNLFSKADCHALLAKSYQKQNQKDKTFSEINKSIAINQQLNNTTRVIQNKIFLAEHYLDYNIPKATQIGEEVLRIIDFSTEKKSKSSLYHVLYQCYKQSGKIELSHDMYEKYIVYNDSVVKEQSNLALIKEAVNQEYQVRISKNKASFEKIERELKFSQYQKISFLFIVFAFLFFSLFFYFRRKNNYDRIKRNELIEEIEILKRSTHAINSVKTENFVLNRTEVENAINRKLNETDWSVLNVLSQNPVISNKELAEKVFMSVDGIGSSLRRMYDYFDIEDSKYKKTDLIRKVIQLSNKSTSPIWVISTNFEIFTPSLLTESFLTTTLPFR